MGFFQNVPYFVYLALVFLSLIIGIFVGSSFRLKPPRKEKRKEVKKAYLNGINLLLANEHDKAIEEFTKAVKIDSNTTEIYFALGSLFRAKGDVSRALKIHQSITLRPSLDEKTRLKALFEVGTDFKKAGFIKRAIATFEDVIAKQPNMVKAYPPVRELYEETGEWEKAFVLQQKLSRFEKGKDNNLLAHLQTELGKSLVDKGDNSLAIKAFKKAIRLDQTCVDAYLHLGDVYSSQGEHSKAIDTWKNIPREKPRFAYLAYPRLRESYFNLNRFDAMEDLLREISKKHHQDVYTHLALAQYLYKKNAVEETIKELRIALDINPDFNEARKEIARVLSKEGREREALEELQKLLERLTSPHKDFQCKECGYESAILEWKCPKCLRWDVIDFKENNQKAIA